MSKDKVLVFGAGISGIGSVRLLEQKGEPVILYDGNVKLSEEDVRSRLPEGSQAGIVLGEMPEHLLDEVKLAVLSPGVPTDIEPVVRIRKAGIPIWGELELAWSCEQGQVLAVTGTNGKTTTVTLLGEIMKYHAQMQTEPVTSEAFVAGNIGTAYTQTAPQTSAQSVSVVEVSSFQLETIEHFHPRVSAITNITPDHLNRHHTMEEYTRVKERIAQNQTAEDTCVLNYEDERLRTFGEQARCRVIFFSSQRVLPQGFFMNGDAIEIKDGEHTQRFLSTRELQLPGVHNYENIMTAAAMAYAYGVPLEEIRHVVRRFTAVEHRIEYVATKGGVMYYNDSKGTNPDAAIKGIKAMDRPTILIGGGYDKDSTYDEWIRSFDGKVRTLVLIGQTRDKIAACARANGFEDIIMADSFEEAFAICVREARPGDAVLLSPACASWGMFPNYEVRGKVFKKLVHELPD